jgi:hypothetical protein
LIFYFGIIFARTSYGAMVEIATHIRLTWNDMCGVHSKSNIRKLIILIPYNNFISGSTILERFLSIYFMKTKVHFLGKPFGPKDIVVFKRTIVASLQAYIGPHVNDFCKLKVHLSHKFVVDSSQLDPIGVDFHVKLPPPRL